MTQPPLDAWPKLEALPVEIDSVGARRLRLERSEWARVTTIFSLSGGSHTGEGEDTNYDAATHAGVEELATGWDLTGSWTLASFSARLDELELDPITSAFPGQENYRRWALESAALDLALQQAQTTLAELLGMAPTRMNFCVSMSLSDDAARETFHRWHEQHPELRFKVDAAQSWTPEVVARLAATGAVRVVDIKGHYEGDWIDNTPNPELYRTIAEAFDPAEVVLEDPWLDEDTRAALGERWRGRLAFDAPIHSVADIERFGADLSLCNIKPSRFGTLRELLAAIDHCRTRAIPMYAGGQYELGIGRAQAQDIASTWYPDAWNDLAPVAWHSATPGEEVPLPPLGPRPGPGFGR